MEVSNSLNGSVSIEQLRAQNPATADQFRNRGNQYYAKGNEVINQNIESARQCWKWAVADFKHAIQLNPHHVTYYKDLGNCLLDLGYYEQALSFLNGAIEIATDEITSAYYVVRGKLHLRVAHYQQAIQDFKEAERMGYNQDLQPLIQEAVTKHQNFIKKRELRLQTALNDRMQKLFKQRQVTFSEQNYNTRQHTHDPYFILSLDGGGIRGIFHGLFCSAIEHRSHRPISSLYNLIAGTSTGGIVGLALAAPGGAANVPKFSADDALDLYLSRGSQIFQKPKVNVPHVTIQYVADGLEKIAHDYFGNTRLQQTLTDVLIATYDGEQKKPFLFTRFEAKQNPKHNYYLRDVIRATSAAPTFFPPKIVDEHKFIDGGVATNNPTMAAYSWAEKQGIAKNAIHITSFGTGDPKPMPIKDTVLFRGELFWASTIPGVAMDGANFNVDRDLRNIFFSLPGQYNRFQPILDEPIRLDGIEKHQIEQLVDVGETYIEMEDASEENRINKIVEKLLLFR